MEWQWFINYFVILCFSSLPTSGPPAPYQPQGWGNGYPHWQQGQPDPSEFMLLGGGEILPSSLYERLAQGWANLLT